MTFETSAAKGTILVLPQDSFNVGINMPRNMDKNYRMGILWLSINYCHAYEVSNEKHNQFSDIVINYATLLDKQDRLSGRRSNLEEVIRHLEEAWVVIEKCSCQTEKYGALLNDLGQAYLD